MLAHDIKLILFNWAYHCARVKLEKRESWDVVALEILEAVGISHRPHARDINANVIDTYPKLELLDFPPL